MRSLSCRAAVAVAVLLVGASVRAATLEEIGKALAEKREACSSLSYEQTMVTEMKNAQFSMTSTTSGTYESVKKGDKFLMRMESNGTTEQTVMGNTNTTKSATVTVYDGEFVYNYQEANGQKMAYKSKPGKEQDMGKDWVASMKEHFELKVLPDEAVDGEDCYVIECNPKEKNAAGMTMTHWIAKSSGVPVKSVTKMPQGGTATMTVKNIKINPSIGADRFVFKAPEGVTVQDMSQMGQGAGGGE